jgi:hypothetical protein
MNPIFYTSLNFSRICIIAACTLTLLLGACTATMGGKVFERNSIVIKEIDLQVLQASFNLNAEDSKFVREAGFGTDNFYKDIFLSTTEVLSANGIFPTSTKKTEYILEIKPSDLIIVTEQQNAKVRRRVLYFSISLIRRGQPEPLWSEKSHFDLAIINPAVQAARAVQPRFKSVDFRSIALSKLNIMQREEIISLPAGYAVTEKGNRRYLLGE